MRHKYSLPVFFDGTSNDVGRETMIRAVLRLVFRSTVGSIPRVVAGTPRKVGGQRNVDVVEGPRQNDDVVRI